MLSIFLFLSSTPLLPTISKYSWHQLIILLIILFAIRLPSILTYTHHTLLSNNSAIDLISGSLILLTLWISSLILLARYKIKNLGITLTPFILTVLILTLVLCLCFRASNLLSFYVWFEASLIPTILLIIIWGYQPERIQARIYLIIYTVTASLPLLLILCSIYLASGHLTISYPWINLPLNINPTVIWLILMIAFLVKLPLFSVHLWLPKAHVEAPVAGSIVLAAILLKLGGYGLIRITLLFPENIKIMYAPITSIALIGATITRLICLRQTDLKSLIAYSSVGHIGLLIAGVISNTQIGIYGALAIIIAHGLVSSGLFCMANMTYELTHTRRVALTKGLLTSIPIISLWWFLLVCANIAAPPSINLLREILLITSTASQAVFLILPLSLISFFTAAYSYFIYSRINHGWPTSTTNALTGIRTHNYLLIILHITPTIALILTADLITNWLWYYSWITTLNCRFNSVLTH